MNSTPTLSEWRIDGRLIAFSVLDILPGCVSSVYFVWDPEYAWASLGKLSAVREAALAREIAQAGMTDMGWLYMGKNRSGKAMLTKC